MAFRKPVVVFELLSRVLLFFDPMDCSPSGSSVLGISRARILEWVAISFSRGSFPPGVKPISPVLAGRFLTSEPPGKSDGGSDPHPPASGQQEVHLPLSSHVGGLVPSGPPVTCRDPDLRKVDTPGSHQEPSQLMGTMWTPPACLALAVGCWLPLILRRLSLSPRGPWELSGRAQAGQSLRTD